MSIKSISSYPAPPPQLILPLSFISRHSLSPRDRQSFIFGFYILFHKAFPDIVHLCITTSLNNSSLSFCLLIQLYQYQPPTSVSTETFLEATASTSVSSDTCIPPHKPSPSQLLETSLSNSFLCSILYLNYAISTRGKARISRVY